MHFSVLEQSGRKHRDDYDYDHDCIYEWAGWRAASS